MSNDWLGKLRELRDEPIPILSVLEPPCKNCKNWKPHREAEVVTGTKGRLIVAGVVCCIAAEMYQDFSCFEAGEQE